MKEIRRPSTRIIPSDPFQEFHCNKLNCYRFEARQAVPRFKIRKDSILYADKIQPHRGDVVICSSSHDSSFFIGVLVKKKGHRVVIELPSGIIFMAFSEAV